MAASTVAIAAILEGALRLRAPEDIESLRRAKQRGPVESCDNLFVLDEARGWHLVPNCTVTADSSTVPVYRFTIHSNNHGFRDYKDYELRRSDGVTRVVVLGDSFGYGNGVEELGRYSTLLEGLLGQNVEIYNLAISNYGLDQALLTLESSGLRYRPDLILVGFSDPMFQRLSRKAPHSFWSKPFFEIGERGTLEPGARPGDDLLAFEALLDHSYLWLFATRRASSWLRELRKEEKAAQNAVLAGRIIERFVEDADQAKAGLLFFTINADYTLRRRPPAPVPEVNRVLAEERRKGGFELLDLYPVFKSVDYRSLFLPRDGHYNVDGHILIAEQLCDFVRSHDLLPGATIPSSCEVDEGAVQRAIEAFRACRLSEVDERLFPRGKCIPRH